MGILARFPRLAAWIFVCSLIVAVTAEALVGLYELQPIPSYTTEHMHGVIAAVRGHTEFAIRPDGEGKIVWMEVTAETPISFAHLARHLAEHAATDVEYITLPSGVKYALSAD